MWVVKSGFGRKQAKVWGSFESREEILSFAEKEICPGNWEQFSEGENYIEWKSEKNRDAWVVAFRIKIFS